MSAWVSVKERLPEYAGEYLVATNYSHIFIFDYIRGVWLGEDKHGIVYEEATHWQPLPAPPEGDK